jgi:hypothetical protein
MRQQALIVGFMIAVASPAFANQGESSFTPSSLYLPVRFIRLGNTTTNQQVQLYRCPTERDPSLPPDAGSGGSGGTLADAGSAGVTGTVADDSDAGANPEVLADDCLIDMADNAALAALFSSPIDIDPGTYDTIHVDQCRAGDQGYSSFVKGSVKLKGTTYYTTSGGDDVLTTTRADSRHVRVDYQGCGAEIPLPRPVTLAAGDHLNVSAFFSLRNIAWATIDENSSLGGCAFNASRSQNVCTGYPIPVASIGATTPVVETYYITEDQTDLDAVKAGGQMLILRDGVAGEPFGGISRRLYSADSVQPSGNYDTPIKSIMINLDPSTYRIQTYGGGGPGGVAVEFYLLFPAFQLETHNGMFIGPDGMTEVPYRAVKQLH